MIVRRFSEAKPYEAVVDGKEHVLTANDSCYIGPNEQREIVNRSNDVCTIVVAMLPPRK